MKQKLALEPGMGFYLREDAMGFAKQRYFEELDRIEGNRHVAEEILVRAGILQRCSACQESFDKYGIVYSEMDLEPA